MDPKSNLELYPWFSALIFTPVFVPVLVLFWQDNGLDLSQIYVLQGLFALAVVLLELPTGLVADRLGKRASLIAANVCFLVFLTVYGLASGFWGFLFAEIGMALGAALYSGADSALLYDSLKALGREDEYEERQGRASAWRMAAFAVASVLGGFLGAISLRATVWLSLIGPLYTLTLVVRFVEVNPPAPSEGLRDAWKQTWALFSSATRFVRKHQLVRWQIAMMAVLSGSATWLLWVYQPYMELTGLPVWAFGVAFGIYNLVAALCSRYAATLTARTGDGGAWVVLGGLQLAPLFLMALLPVPFAWLFVLGHQAVRGMLGPIATRRILAYTRADKRSTVLSISSLAGRLFFTLTAPVLAWTAAALTIPQAIGVQGLLLSQLLFVLWLVYRRLPAKYFTIKTQA